MVSRDFCITTCPPLVLYLVIGTRSTQGMGKLRHSEADQSHGTWEMNLRNLRDARVQGWLHGRSGSFEADWGSAWCFPSEAELTEEGDSSDEHITCHTWMLRCSDCFLHNQHGVTHLSD